MNFLSAVYEKYAALPEEASAHPASQIVISGKVAEEVGFDKIREQQARLNELKIVIVDGMRIKKGNHAVLRTAITEQCPNIVELDMSRNLFETFMQVYIIVEPLGFLRRLRLK